eukprot:5530346-Prorocentrum_lima.AAC.1
MLQQHTHPSHGLRRRLDPPAVRSRAPACQCLQRGVPRTTRLASDVRICHTATLPAALRMVKPGSDCGGRSTRTLWAT